MAPTAPKMDLHTIIEQRGGVLLVTVYGDFALDAGLRLFKQACEIAAEKQVNKILFNGLPMGGSISTLDRYKLGVEMAAYLNPDKMNLKLAFVGKPPTMDGFAAQVAQNRDVLIEMFSSEQEALNWFERWSS
jgi:hypothetical protein